MKYIAHRGALKHQNKLIGIKKAHSVIGCVEVDVRYNTHKQLVLCHDREQRNSPYNDTLEMLCNEVEPMHIVLDIKAFGITQAQEIARDIFKTIYVSTHTFELCSFNEYCVTELADLRDTGNKNFKLGVISSGIPLGMFGDIPIDFASLDYSVIDNDIVDILHSRNVQIYAFTVNNKFIEEQLKTYNIDGIIKDFNLDV